MSFQCRTMPVSAQRIIQTALILHAIQQTFNHVVEGSIPSRLTINLNDLAVWQSCGFSNGLDSSIPVPFVP